MKNSATVKLLALILALAAMLCGCKKTFDDAAETTAATSEATTSEAIDTAYEDIARFDSQSMERIDFSRMGDPYKLTLEAPAEWKLYASDNGFAIYREDVMIGEIFSGDAEDTAEWTVLKSEESIDGGILTNMYIERRDAAEGAEYRYRFYYYYSFGTTERITTMTVKLEEIDELVEKKLAISASVSLISTDPQLGVIDLGNRKVTNIAILGNSFVGTSNIGAIVREMFELNGKSCSVEAISWGMANISTFTGDEETMRHIRRGMYDIVFMCGLYSNSQVNELTALKSACAESSTALVVFPAHNESLSAINQAKNSYPDLIFLNWKNEIDQLMMNKNIDRSVFCINDSYNHSTPAAGYVGAHMIYRAMYGEIPTAALSSSISQSYVNGFLGDYVTTGSIALSYRSDINYLG